MATSLRRSTVARLKRPGYDDLVFAVVFVWGTGDLFSTLLALYYTGVWAEANPMIRTLLAHEPLIVVALKGAVMLLVGIVLFEYRSAVERVPRWRLWLASIVGLGTGVVGINLYVAYAAA